MILTDGLHLVSTKSLEELHFFARHIGLPLEWFQDHRIPHYDIYGRKRQQAFINRAKIVTPRYLVRRAIRKDSISS